MDKKQALQGILNYPLSDFSLEKALIDAGIDGSQNYTMADKEAIDLVAAGLILVILGSPESVSEGGYSITKSKKDDLLALRSFILGTYGLEDKPTIRAINGW